MVHRAYKAVIRTSELDREPVAYSTGDFLVKPYGCGAREKTVGPNSLESGAADAAPWDDMPALEYDTDDEPVARIRNGGESVAATLEKIRLGTHMMNRSLKEKLTYYPTGYPSSTLYVDMGVWNLLAKDDQEILLRHVDHVEAYPDVEVQGVKLIWDIDPDYFTLDQELYWAVAYFAQDESDMNKHVKLLRMLWNSRREGRQLENVRQAMLTKGKALHLYPWVEPGMQLADFEDPKFSPMATMEHTSNWFDRQRFADAKYALYVLRPTEQDHIWIRQYTQWILSKSDETCKDPEQCIQARMESKLWMLSRSTSLARN